MKADHGETSVRVVQVNEDLKRLSCQKNAPLAPLLPSPAEIAWKAGYWSQSRG